MSVVCAVRASDSESTKIFSGRIALSRGDSLMSLIPRTAIRTQSRLPVSLPKVHGTSVNFFDLASSRMATDRIELEALERFTVHNGSNSIRNTLAEQLPRISRQAIDSAIQLCFSPSDNAVVQLLGTQPFGVIVTDRSMGSSRRKTVSVEPMDSLGRLLCQPGAPPASPQ